MIITEIGGQPIHELAERYGTPIYVYDTQSIAQKVKSLKGFPTIRYAQKANANLTILSLLRRQKVLVDAVSIGEIHRAMRAGYTPKQVVYTADIFDRPTLDMVIKLGVGVNCGSPEMISQYGEKVENGTVTIRVNPGFGHGHSQKTNTGGEQSKHGIWHDQIPQVLERANRHGVRITGLHMHIGSGTDFNHLSQVCDAMTRVADRIGTSLEMISAGGGLPIPYRPEDKPIDVEAYTQLWLQTRKVISSRLGKEIELEVEPGRYLVAESGFLVAEIRAVKQMGANTFYLVNAGFNTLARPVMYGAYHPMSIAYRSADRGDDGYRIPVVVGGPLCESGDIFTQREGGLVETRSLPRADVGDYLVIQNAGAYGFTMASTYNSIPLPAEVVVHDGQAHLARERQTVDDLIRGERVVALR
jgi:diaminopimelate decarboxylase